MILGFVIGNLAFAFISMDLESISAGEISTDISPQRMRFGLFVSHFFTFAIPGFVALWLTYRKKWWAAVNPIAFPGRSLPIVIVFGLVALPLVALSMWVNLQIDLPEWAVQTENQTSELLEKVLTFKSPAGLAMALLAVAFAAGVGEELIFRGILQGRVFSKLNHHLAIWLAAAIFSLIHLEMAGFLPRMVLGAILGYIFHWSGSLLVVMLLHMFFNGAQVVNAYVTGEFTPDTAETELPEWYLMLGSALLSFAIGYYLEQKHSKPTLEQV